MYVSMYACIYVCMYLCTCVSMYLRIYLILPRNDIGVCSQIKHLYRKKVRKVKLFATKR